MTTKEAIYFRDEDNKDFGLKRLGNTPYVIANVGDSSGNLVNVLLNEQSGQYELLTNLRGHVCEENSTTTNLDADEVFTGEWQDTIDYGTVTVGIKSDQDSAVDGLMIEWSADGVTKAQDDVFTLSANSGKVFTFGPANRYVRVVYTNGGVQTTSLNIQTILRRVFIKPSSHRINDSIVAEDDAQLMKTVLTGENPAGTFVNFQATTAGNFKVSLEELENQVSTNSNSQLNTSPYLVDEFGNYSHVLGDNIFKGSIIAIPPEHHEIHCGDRYSGYYSGDLANGASMTFVVVVPNEGLDDQGEEGSDQSSKQYHVVYYIDVEAEATVIGYEGATLSNNGTAISIGNRNRNSTRTDYLGFYHTPTVTDPGSIIFPTKRIGSGKSVGGTVGRGTEFILKDNTVYLTTITNATTSNNYFNIEVDYYVHPGV